MKHKYSAFDRSRRCAKRHKVRKGGATEHSQARPAPQCCSDHVEAAKTGHVECLRRLQEVGSFLGLHDPDRESAGEARKLEVWDAAVAACKAGHAQVLSWLFSGGWPDTIDAKLPWYLSDQAQPREEGDWEELDLRGMPHRQESFLPEVKLSRYAMRNSDASCLEALLNAGCRSEWLCPLAALEGREGHLALAAERSARCDARSMYHAASTGNLPVLQTAHQHATIQAGATSGRPLLDWCGKDTLSQCFVAAAQNGHADCLAALLTWFDAKYLWYIASEAAAEGGHVSCLEELRRRCWEDWTPAECRAAKNGQVDAMLYLLELSQLQIGRHDEIGRVMVSAAGGGQLACLKLLHERFSLNDITDQLTREFIVRCAVESGKPECLQYVLSHIGGALPIRSMLRRLLWYKSPSSLKVLYDRGCLPQSRQFWDLLLQVPPRYLPVKDLELLKMMVANSGRPPTAVLSTAVAASQGFAFLQYVHELGAPWNATTMRNAQASLIMMRYAHENGCPWGEAVMSHFIGKVECLQYAHENGCAYDVPARSTALPDFQVLQHAWKRMDRGWVRQVVGNAVKHGFSTQGVWGGDGVLDPVGGFELRSSRSSASKFDWRVPLYLVKEMKMGRDELGVLAQLADVRLARAAALAQCFYVAGKYVRELRSGPWADLWSAMARCPSEIREKIASDAHLALPPLWLFDASLVT